MDEETIRAEVDPQGGRATLTFLPASGVEGKMVLSAVQLEKLIHGLGKIHQALLADRELPDLTGLKIEAAARNRWYVQFDALAEGSVLCFYHPSFGPLGFLIPADQAQHMASLLSRHFALREEMHHQKPN